jgi:hypothetical protein
MAKRLTGSPEELRQQASRCSARALSWLKRGAEYERKARILERKRSTWEKQKWPEEFCEQCRKGDGKCFLHRKDAIDSVPA